MTDFKIRRGLYDQLFDENGDLLRDGVVLEEGCWYLCTDKAWLYLCVENADGELDLKLINKAVTAVNRPTTTPGGGNNSTAGDLLVNSVIYADINAAGKLTVYYADGTSEVLGTVVGKDGEPGKDGNDGVGIADAALYDGRLVITLSNGSVIDLGNVKGQDGQDGKDGFVTAIKIGKNIYEHVDGTIELPNLVTKHFVETQISNIEIPDVSDFITKQEVENKKYLTKIPDEYITETELDTKQYATESYVNNKVATVDLTGYVKKVDVPDFTLYAKKAELPDFSLYAKKTETLSEIPAEYITESELTNKGYATEAFVTKQIAEAKPDYSDLDLSEYVTESELTAKGYLTEHQSLDGFATEQYVNEAIGSINIPETDLSDYYTKSEVITELTNAVTDKVDKVLFTTAMYVTNPIGNFSAGDNIKGLTIAKLFAKLLGLSEINPNIKTPETIVQEIIEKELSMYSVTDRRAIEALEFNYSTLDTASAQRMPSDSGFYQVYDNSGKLIESGYQELTITNPNIPYIIALPVDIDFNSMVTVQVYDTFENTWKNSSLNLSNDYTAISSMCNSLGIDISHIDTTEYMLWADLKMGPSGKIYRFIIA